MPADGTWTRLTLNSRAAERAAMTPGLLWLMAATAGISVANLYYNQPLLVLIGKSFGVSAQQVGLVPTLTQLGYALGLLLFVPLGDMLERRRLIVTMLGATALALVAAATAQSIVWLQAASLAVGVATIVPQLVIPFAVLLAGPKEQSKAIGGVMGGLLLGIVGARALSGFVGASLGWRAVYAGASVMMLLLAAASARWLPQSPPSHALSYPQLMASLLRLIREQPILREAALMQAMLFGAFSAFWATFAFFLAQPPYQLGSQAVGLFALTGLVGAGTAIIAGRLVSRHNPRRLVGGALGAVVGAFLLFWSLGDHLWALLCGLILLDLGAQGAMVPNQTRVYSLLPEARSRLNTVFMVSSFTGGSVGSALGAYGWSLLRWDGVCLVAFLLIAVATATYLAGGRGRREIR